MTITLEAVLAQVESGTRDDRPRFEPVLYARWTTRPLTTAQRDVIDAIMTIHVCSYWTAVMLACTSWGRYQLLGENIYSVGQFKESIFAFVRDPWKQVTCVDAFLKARGVAFTLTELVMDRVKREQFVTVYNGPGNVQAYWATMCAAIQALGGPIVVEEGVST